jgi:hypothetical protein
MKKKRLKHCPLTHAPQMDDTVIPQWELLGRFFDLLLRIDKRNSPKLYGEHIGSDNKELTP